MIYETEAKGKTLSGIVTLGSKPGYNSDFTYHLNDIVYQLSTINKVRSTAQELVIPCIVQEGTLVGRAGDDEYVEDVYRCNFSWSPRSILQIPKDDFHRALRSYASSLGNALQQERVYIEYDGTTEVLKKKE